MTILQEQPLGPAVPPEIAATSLDPPRDLEYPHTPSREGRQLTDAAHTLGTGSSVRNSHAARALAPQCPGIVVLTCRSDDKFVFQRSFPSYSINSAWNSCWRSGGLIRIWRVANPSPYGSYVFHATCDDHVITYYRARAASYESTQRFVIAVACIIILVSAIGLIHIQLIAHSTE
jgi:hypothetical protein